MQVANGEDPEAILRLACASRRHGKIGCTCSRSVFLRVNGVLRAVTKLRPEQANGEAARRPSQGRGRDGPTALIMRHLAPLLCTVYRARGAAGAAAERSLWRQAGAVNLGLSVLDELLRSRSRV